MFLEQKDLIRKVDNTCAQKFVKKIACVGKFAHREHLNGFQCHKSFTMKLVWILLLPN